VIFSLRIDAFFVDLSITLLLALSLYVAFSAGVFSLATVGFSAVGAYTTAVMADDIGAAPAFAVAILFTVALAAAIGPWLLRLSGVYLAMATLALSEAIRIIITNLDSVTGGINGLFGLHITVRGHHAIVIVLVVAVVVWVVHDRTRAGMMARVVRQDEDLARSCGINVGLVRYTAFIGSAAVAAVGGAVNGLAYRFISPEEYSFALLVKALTAVVIGGLSSVAAPLIAGAALGSLREWLRFVKDYEEIISGVVIIVFFALMPEGVGSRWSWVNLAHRLHLIRRTSDSAEDDIRRVTSAAVADVRSSSTASSGDALVVEHLSKSFEGLRAVDDVSFTVGHGEVLGLIGPNGAGKSTTAHLISGFLEPDEGTASLDGHALSHTPPHRNHRAGLRRVFQGSHVVEVFGARENIAVGESGRVLGSAPGRRDRPLYVRNLSYGAKRWIEIARAVAVPGSLYLFDEPTAGLTPDDVRQFAETVRRLAAGGAAVVLVEHDVALVRDVCDRVVVLSWGRVLATGSPDEVFERPEVRSAYLAHADDADAAAAR
jgi:branched-chain amino acid transport system permease protein